MGSANAQTGATCVQLGPGGPGTCAGQDPATACQASSRDVRSLSDFANAATGLVVLRIRTTDQDDQPVLDFWRCPMLPLRDPDVRTGHADAFDAIPAELNRAAVRAAAP